MTAKGTVRGNIVALDEGEKLPDGSRSAPNLTSRCRAGCLG